MKRAAGKADPESVRLDATAWISRALEVLAERGIDGVRVEVLAKDLGVTKGSFYWHFKDRAALQEALLQEWRRRATLGIIERLEASHEPAGVRLQHLMRLPFDARHADIGADIELSVRLWGRHDERAAKILTEIDELRLRYIAGLLEEAGLAKPDARARAILIYAYMRVSRSLLDGRSDRAVIQACEAFLSAP